MPSLPPSLQRHSLQPLCSISPSAHFILIPDFVFVSIFCFLIYPTPRPTSQETRPNVVTFSYLGLSAGTSSVTLRAVAATPGNFVFPPVRASADRQPELMGMTAAETFTVCADCQGPTVADVRSRPRACRNDCSGNGLCNLNLGRCSCNPGFGRVDCSRALA